MHRGRMGNPRRLHVLERAEAFAAAVHLLVSRLPVRHTAEIRQQLLRAVASIAFNIAEGAACSSPRQFSSFLSTAIRSANEVESALRLSRRHRLRPTAEIDAYLIELGQIRAMCIGLRRRVEEDARQSGTSGTR